MDETKTKKLIISATVGAVLLLVILLAVMVYQLISIKVLKDKESELDAAIAEYERLIEEGGDTLEARSARWWIELRARELGYVFDGDKILKN